MIREIHSSQSPFLSSAIIFLTTIHLLVSSTTSQQQPTFNTAGCQDNSNSTTPPAYTSNLAALLNTLPRKASTATFSNDSAADGGVFSLYLCRGDVSLTTCAACVTQAAQEVQRRCPAHRAAIVWYDQCMLRYSNVSFAGRAEVQYRLLMWNTQNNTSPGETDNGALSLIYGLIDYVPYTGLMYGTNESESRGQPRYAMAQCTRDLSSGACLSCLEELNDASDRCCRGRIGWRILTPSCSLRYEQSLFYEIPPPPPQSPPGGEDDGGGGGNNTGKIAGIVGAIVGVTVAVVGIWYCSCCRRKKGRSAGGETSQEILLPDYDGSNHNTAIGIEVPGHENDREVHCYSLATILAATNNFSNANKLGQGGFGPVYKGKLQDGQEIAVKRLSLTSKQGLEEFRNEVMVIVKLQHRNLVRLLGYCLERGEKLLVYEYLANTSLDAFLFDPKKSKELDWEKRANIVEGTARGLMYLHEDSRLKIIHRDMKASNVLLDDQMNPKISDFGTARIFGGNQIEANTERVVGTYGYMAPEYALEGVISTKSDVYSFGILMLEIISGKKNRGSFDPSQASSLLLQAWELWSEGRGEELIDSNIAKNCPARWIHIALLCTQDDPAERPTMSAVVRMLGSKSDDDLPRQLKRPFTAGGFTHVSDLSSSTSGTGTGFLTSDQSTGTS
ncbi:unnamed protein product [Linum tenue]|uniref:Cysteine-rich receptor-like protein kinase 10 n=1 Tax=Linum tenue TaxID=586396 RepID=A0AAV0PBC3_9ROSI|nr:unnamed protein product [Linum tenue]